MSTTHNKEEIFSQKPYNPFAFLQSEADCCDLAAGVIKNFQPNGKIDNDPFFVRARSALLRAIILYLYKECRWRERNFTSLMKLLNAAIVEEGNDEHKSPLNIIFEDLAKIDPLHPGVREYWVFKQATPESAAIIIEDIENNLEAFGWTRCVRRPSVPVPYIHYMQQQVRLLKMERKE